MPQELRMCAFQDAVHLSFRTRVGDRQEVKIYVAAISSGHKRSACTEALVGIPVWGCMEGLGQYVFI